MNKRLDPTLFSARYCLLTRLRKRMEAIALRHVAPREGMLVVDFGCGDMPYRPLFARNGARYCGIDLPENRLADLHVSPGGSAPLADGIADVVLSTQVLEHVPDPQAYLRECRRMLKPQGLMVVSTHGCWVYHPAPQDLWRWTGPGLRKTVAAAGYEVLEVNGVMGLAASGMQLFQDGVMRSLPWFIRPVVPLVLQPLIALSDLLSSDADREDDACVFVVVARKGSAD